MNKNKLLIIVPLLLAALVVNQCGGGQVVDDAPDQYLSGASKADAEKAVQGAQEAYTTLADESSAEAGSAKRYLDKAKEYQIEGEYEAAWAFAQKSKSFSLLAAYMKQTRAANLK